METVTHDLTSPEVIPDKGWAQGYRVGIACSCGWDKGNNESEAEARMWGDMHIEATHRGLTEPMPELTVAWDPRNVDPDELVWLRSKALELIAEAGRTGHLRARELLWGNTFWPAQEELGRQRLAVEATVNEVEWEGHRAFVAYSVDEGYLYLCSCEDFEFRQEPQKLDPDLVGVIRRYAGHLEHHGIDPWARELVVKSPTGDVPPDDLDAAEARARELPPIPPRYQDDA